MGPFPPLPRREGLRGRVKDHCKQFNLTISNTPSRFSKTTLFQNLKTVNPFSSRYLSLRMSMSLSVTCCPPSSSIDDPLFKTDKVNNEILDRLLMSELYPFDLSAFEPQPPKDLSISRPSSQDLCELCKSLCLLPRLFPPPLYPLPPGEGILSNKL